MLVPLKLPPGLFQNGTLYQAKDRWARANLVRFYEKTIRPVGGWQEFKAEGQAAANYFSDSFNDGVGNYLELRGPNGSPHSFTWARSTLPAWNTSYSTQTVTVGDATVPYATLDVSVSGHWGTGITGCTDVSNTVMPVADYTVSVNIGLPRSINTMVFWEGGVVARASADGTGGYRLAVNSPVANPGTVSLTLSRVSAGGVATTLASATGIVLPTGVAYPLVLTVQGSTITGTLNGGHTVTATDSTTSSAGRPGVWGNAGHDSASGEAYIMWISNWASSTLDNSTITLNGVPRSIIGWRGSDGNQTVAIGTNTKLYAHLGGSLYDITPSGFTTGAVDAVYTTGNYGSGVYGAGPYGVSDPAQTTFVPPAVFQLDTFGEYLVACSSPNDGKLYVWDRSINDIAVVMSGAPTQCIGVVVTPERFVVALGAGGVSRHIQWASQETTDTWTPDVSNTAGSLDLEGVGILVGGRRGKGETILWTTDDVHALRYIGGTLVYAVERVGGKCGLLSPNAVAMVDDKAVWMSKGQFFLYDGYVQAIPCEVSDEVFSDFNTNQSGKVTCLPISRFGEIWWFYPSAASTENDKYVVWNYRENHWTTGALPRTAGCDSGAIDYPLLASPNGKLWEHERTFTHTDLSGNTLAPYLESGPVEAGEGDQVLYISQILPDERTLGQVQLSLYGSFEPMADETLYGPFTIGKNTDARMTARWVRLRLDEVVEEDWRVGVIRLDGKPAGSRGSPR